MNPVHPRILHPPKRHLWILSIGLASVCVVPSEARTWRVPQDAPTIQAGIDSASVGDDVLVASGTYFEHNIDLSKPIVLHSVAGAASTIIDGNAVSSVIDAHDVPDGCTIEGFTIRAGRSDTWNGGGGIVLDSARATVSACVIEECEAANGGGISALDAFLTIEDCRFEDNESGAGGAIVAFENATAGTELHISNTQFLNNYASSGGLGPSTGGAIAASVARITITDCLFAGNGLGPHPDGAAIFLGSLTCMISGCTFVGNESWWTDDVSIVALLSGAGVVERCIFAFNAGVPFLCWGETARLSCSNVYQNTADASCPIDAGANFSMDPLFCDLEGGDYSLEAESPCLPGQHPDGAACGLIGAFGAGCESTPIERTSWGRIKALYRP
jgi:hypothetical protein